ncbi:MAG: helix-turn-helix domain-containing protein [bacterium]
MSIQEQLQSLGLSEKEARVYMSSLELGSSAVQEIARKAGVNRATTYVQIEALLKKGLMSSVIRGKKRYFSAENPGYLLKLLDIKMGEINDKRKEFEKYIPELEAMFDNAQEKPKVKYYEGLEGLRSVQQDFFMTNSKEVKEITDLDRAYQAFPPHPKDHRSKRKGKNTYTFAKVIYSYSEGAILPKKENFRERYFVAKGKIKFSSDILIYGENKVAFLNTIKRNGVIIENKEIHDTLNSLFDLAKEGIEKYNNK